MDKVSSAKGISMGSLGGWNLRGKLQNVQQDFSLSLKSISQKARREARVVNIKARKALAVEDVHSVRDDQVFECNLDVGHDLYKKFQSHWVQIHEDSVTNAKCALDADELILSILKSWQKWEVDVTCLHSNIVSLPDILTKVEIANNNIESLGKQMRKLEMMILEYEDLVERIDQESKKMKEKETLSHVIEQKDLAFQKRKESISLSAAEKRERAASMKEEMERQDSYEKQQAYEDAFLQQMNEYIQMGKVEAPIAGHAGHGTDLGDVVIDDADLNTLSEFLGPEELDSVIKSQAALNRSSDFLSSSSSNSTREDVFVSDAVPKDGKDLTELEDEVSMVEPTIEADMIGTSEKISEDCSVTTTDSNEDQN